MKTGSSSSARRVIVKLSLAGALFALPLTGVCIPADAAPAPAVPTNYGALPAPPPADPPSPAPAPPAQPAPSQYTYYAPADDFCYGCGGGGGGG